MLVVSPCRGRFKFFPTSVPRVVHQTCNQWLQDFLFHSIRTSWTQFQSLPCELVSVECSIWVPCSELVSSLHLEMDSSIQA